MKDTESDEDYGRRWCKQMNKYPDVDEGSGERTRFWWRRHDDAKDRPHCLPLPLWSFPGMFDLRISGVMYYKESDAYAVVGQAVRAFHEAVPQLPPLRPK